MGKRICTLSERDFGRYVWYDINFGLLLKFGLVICDGPPGWTKGGRYGLIPLMKGKLEKGSLILLDDASREEEQIIADKWKKEFGVVVEISEIRKPFFKITV